MECRPDISIIIPVYNVAGFLRQCMESVVNQTYTNIEIICVDDGSTDESGRILQEYSRKDPRVKMLQNKNTGVSAARNRALSLASGCFVLFVDGDDWIELNTCEIAVAQTEQYSADVVMWPYIREYPNQSLGKDLFPKKIVFGEAECHTLQRRIVGLVGEELAHPENIDSLATVWGKLYRREIIVQNSIRFTDLQRIGSNEDGLFNFLYFEHIKKAVYIPQYLSHYRKTNSQSITSRYRPDLPEKWDELYSVFQGYISALSKTNAYRVPFLNRVACGMIGLGLNEVSDGSSVWKQAKRLNAILKKPLYREAFEQLDTGSCGVKWKLFFFLCKKRMTLFLALLLHLMNYLRARVAA